MSDSSGSQPMSAVGDDNLKKQLLELMAQKQAIEKKIAELSSSTVPRDMPLVDADGFPRADLDVHTIRITRNELATLHTDHRDLMKRIATTMNEYHATLPKRPAAARTGETAGGSGVEKKEEKRSQPAPTSPQQPVAEQPQIQPSSSAAAVASEPFYLVDQVSDDSPASAAGLRLGDKVVQFGSVTKANEQKDSIVGVVKSSVGQPIRVVVNRGSSIVELRLVPQEWSGRGLLGCHLSPMR